MSITAEISDFIKSEAAKIGFDDCGIAKVEKLHDEEKHLSSWLHNRFHASMEYMQNNFDKRLNPALLVDEAKSVVSLLISYNSDAVQNQAAPKIARYAFGNDYHQIIKNKLFCLLESIQKKYPHTAGRAFVDSAPVLERAWAVRAGLGWIGKSSAFISPTFGSFVFLAELILNVDLEYDKAFDRHPCGACNRCIANCPTVAIEKPFVINTDKCISYQTIENKGEISVATHGWLFGCDVCLQICPFNKTAKRCNHKEFEAITEILNMTVANWQNIDEREFKRIFKSSPLMRTKFEGIKRNLSKL